MEALGLADIARLAAGLGRPVRREVIGDDDLRARMAARGAPDGAVAVTLGLYAAARAGEFRLVDPMLATLLGRQPTPMRDLIAESIAGPA